MNAVELKKLTSSWSSGYFEIYEDESRVLGFYEGRGGFDEKNSIFIDSPHADLRKEEIEEELQSLLTGTCFQRSEDDDVSTGSSYALAFESDLDAANLYSSIVKIVSKG